MGAPRSERSPLSGGGPSIFSEFTIADLWCGGGAARVTSRPSPRSAYRAVPGSPGPRHGVTVTKKHTKNVAWSLEGRQARHGREEERRAEGLGSSGGDAAQSWGRRGRRTEAPSGVRSGGGPPVGDDEKYDGESFFFSEFTIADLWCRGGARDARHVTAVTPVRLPSGAGTGWRRTQRRRTGGSGLGRQKPASACSLPAALICLPVPTCYLTYAAVG